MVFSSLVFLAAFLPLLLVFYFNPIIKSRRYKNSVLLIFSLFFYWWGEPKFVFVMIISIVFNWIFGLLLYASNKNKKIVLFFSCLYNLGILFIFKYMGFFTPIKNVLLPIGISFFTFQMMSYLFDVYKGDAQIQKNIFDLALYVVMFPQLIAGPIVRYQTVENEIRNRKETISGITSGICRFIKGLAKKVLLANNLAIYADLIFDGKINEISGSVAWLGAVLYTLQIFYDFSGYSDMAIGLGEIFGFHFLENFNFPYMAITISDFWRRWHISMGTWFRDYVYFPLGGSRVKSKVFLVRNLLVVWSLTGLWHGANWTFIIWGLLYFVLILFEKVFNIDKKESFYLHIYTMFFVILGWVLFRSNTIKDAANYYYAMFTSNGIPFFDDALVILSNSWIFICIGIVFCFPVERKIQLRKAYYPIMGGLYLLSLIFVIKGGYNPFIYFNF